MRNVIIAGVVWASTLTLAAEPVVCTITTSAASANTSAPTSGSCSWPKGANVLVQCDQDIYIDSTATSPAVPTASSADELVAFASNKEPKIVYLNSQEQHIAVIQVTTGGTCKFMTTLRPKPWSKVPR